MSKFKSHLDLHCFLYLFVASRVSESHHEKKGAKSRHRLESAGGPEKKDEDIPGGM